MNQLQIDEQILGASFWENWNYAKELHRMGHSKAKQQFKAAMSIRDQWNAKKKQRATAGCKPE